jgi:hypothetical protein
MDNNGWQPAIVAPIEHLCPLHRKLFESVPEEVKETRISYIGTKVEVKPVGDNDVGLNGVVLPKGNCQPLAIRVPDRLEEAGGFSCDFYLD